MVPTPTDRLHKLAAIGGLAIALAGAGAALHQYSQTALQDAELYERVMRSTYAYDRFAEVARQRIALAEELGKGTASPERQAQIRQQLAVLLEKIQPLDREVQESLIQSQKHAAIARHHHRLQVLWVLLGAVAVVVGCYISYRGFLVWVRLPPSER
jgi:hypothetical protein